MLLAASWLHPTGTDYYSCEQKSPSPWPTKTNFKRDDNTNQIPPNRSHRPKWQIERWQQTPTNFPIVALLSDSSHDFRVRRAAHVPPSRRRHHETLATLPVASVVSRAPDAFRTSPDAATVRSPRSCLSPVALLAGAGRSFWAEFFCSSADVDGLLHFMNAVKVGFVYYMGVNKLLERSAGKIALLVYR